MTVSHHGLFGVNLLRRRVGDLLDDGGDVGGTVELQLGEAGLVGLHHTLDTCQHRKTAWKPVSGSTNTSKLLQKIHTVKS